MFETSQAWARGRREKITTPAAHRRVREMSNTLKPGLANHENDEMHNHLLFSLRTERASNLIRLLAMTQHFLSSPPWPSILRTFRERERELHVIPRSAVADVWNTMMRSRESCAPPLLLVLPHCVITNHKATEIHPLLARSFYLPYSRQRNRAELWSLSLSPNPGSI